jgi:hypothetical protein
MSDFHEVLWALWYRLGSTTSFEFATAGMADGGCAKFWAGSNVDIMDLMFFKWCVVLYQTFGK